MLGYGSFITAIINFLIIAFVLFIAIKQIERLKKPEAAPAPGRRPLRRARSPAGGNHDALVKK